MTAQEFADCLNSVEKRRLITSHEGDMASDNGLVIVYAESCDLTEFDGSIRDTINWEFGGLAYLDESGVWLDKCGNSDCPYNREARAKRKTVRAVYNDEEPFRTYETLIPHSVFNIYDGKENEDRVLWCVGIVFEMSSLSDNDG